MGFDYSASGILALSIVMIVVSVFSTTLRFWSRTVVLNKDYRLDDWFALVATIFALAQLASSPIFVADGLGSEIASVPRNKLEAALKTFYAESLINCFALTFIKLSQLAFYIRLFRFRSNPSTFWKISLSITTVFAIIYPMWAVPLLALRCNPVEKNWKPLVAGHCLNLLDVTIVYSVYNIFTDFLILLQPLPALFILHVKASKKVFLAIAFIIGYSAPIIAIGRLVTVIVLSNSLNSDVTRALVPVGYWLQAEPGISLLAISTPPIYQLLTRLFRFGPKSLFNTRNYDQINSLEKCSTSHLNLRSPPRVRHDSLESESSIEHSYAIPSDAATDRSRGSF